MNTKVKAPQFEATDQDRHMVADPGLWPRWPLLPLKRLIEGGMREHGFLIAGTPATVYMGHVFMAVPPTYKTTSDIMLNWPTKVMYSSHEVMFGAGWVVD